MMKRAIIATTIFATLSIFAILVAPQKTFAEDVDVCCKCLPTPCNASQSTVSGATLEAALVNCTTACGTVDGFSSCVDGPPAPGECTVQIGIRGSAAVVGFTNPICKPGQACTAQIIIGNIIRAVLGIVGSIALLMFIIGGFTWMFAGGGAEKVKKSKEIMVWAGLGLVVIFAAYSIINFIITVAAS